MPVSASRLASLYLTHFDNRLTIKSESSQSKLTQIQLWHRLTAFTIELINEIIKGILF